MCLGTFSSYGGCHCYYSCFCLVISGNEPFRENAQSTNFLGYLLAFFLYNGTTYILTSNDAHGGSPSFDHPRFMVVVKLDPFTLITAPHKLPNLAPFRYN